MNRLVVTTEGSNRLALRETCEAFIKDLWIPAHLSPEMATEFAFDHFKRIIHAELQMLQISHCHPGEVQMIGEP